MKLHAYNNFIAFSFSYTKHNERYNAFMIFSYPNSTDNISDLYNELLDNKYSTINDFNVNLTKYIKIENNIFGYIFSGIVILNFTIDDNPKLISSKTNSSILLNKSLEKNELIQLEFNNNNYSSFNYHLEYTYKVTEPNINLYNIYPDRLGYETLKDFDGIEYFGKTSYHKIILTKNLSKDCYSNCDLCLYEYKFFCITCKSKNFTINNQTKEKICLDKKNEGDFEILYLNEGKENISNIIQDKIKSIEFGKNYKMIGNDFIMLVKPTTSNFNFSSSKVNFSSCEKILRTTNNIPKESIITFFQVEINNTNEHSLVNQIEYEAYNDKREKLNLSICNDSSIQILYLMKSNSSLNVSSINSFKNLNIDIFDIKDKFFSDICMPYSSSSKDMTLSDRIIEFYQNYSFCDDHCLFDEIDLELMTISCNCSVKTSLSVIEPSLKLKQLEDVEKTMAFGIIKCYNLAFSWKNKIKNIGFWIFLVLMTLYISFVCIYFYKGINSVKDYIFKQIEDIGSTKKNNALNKKGKNNIKKNDNLKKKKIKDKKRTKSEPPRKKNNVKHKPIKIEKRYKQNNNKSNKNNSSLNDLKNSSRNIIPKTNKSIINSKKTNISYLTTKGEKKKKGLSKVKKIINLNLINLNLNKNANKDSSSPSNYILNVYTFKEAIKEDLRSVCLIFYIYLLTKQAIFHAFLFKSSLVLFPLRFCQLIFIISCDFALNAFFYFDNKISEKYRYTKNIFLFALTKNVTIILLSTFIGFVLLTLFTKLSNSINEIREVFKKEEQMFRKNKNHQINEKGIKKVIENILKKYKIKVIILIVIQFLLILFFWYYVTVFCHVYYNTQTSWILDSIFSMLFRIIIDSLLCLFFAKLYRVAIESNIEWIYKVSLFFYSFC